MTSVIKTFHLPGAKRYPDVPDSPRDMTSHEYRAWRVGLSQKGGARQSNRDKRMGISLPSVGQHLKLEDE